MGVHDGHRQRLKEQFLNCGVGSFKPHQLLELLLFYAIPRRDTNEIAHRLLDQFGSLQGVFRAGAEELCGVEGMGLGAAALIRLVGDISIITQQSETPDTVFKSAEDVGAFFLDLLRGQKNELAYVACLDAKCKLLTCRCVSKGTVGNVSVSPRQVVEQAMYAGARSVVIAHNHPGGVAIPSKGDIYATGRIWKALNVLDIPLIDHIIVADNGYTSMVKSGIFTRYQNDSHGIYG